MAEKEKKYKSAELSDDELTMAAGGKGDSESDIMKGGKYPNNRWHTPGGKGKDVRVMCPYCGEIFQSEYYQGAGLFGWKCLKCGKTVYAS